MYNGIGLSTPRGSGTNGYVVRNLSFKKTPTQRVQYEDYEIKKPPAFREPNKDILLHEKKREVEVRCMALRDDLEEHGMAEADIDERVDALRQSLIQKLDQAGTKQAKSLLEHETHKRAEAKQRENDKMMKALGIDRQDYTEGAAFDRDLQEQKKRARIEAHEAAEEERRKTREHRERRRSRSPDDRDLRRRESKSTDNRRSRRHSYSVTLSEKNSNTLKCIRKLLRLAMPVGLSKKKRAGNGKQPTGMANGDSGESGPKKSSKRNVEEYEEDSDSDLDLEGLEIHSADSDQEEVSESDGEEFENSDEGSLLEEGDTGGSKIDGFASESDESEDDEVTPSTPGNADGQYMRPKLPEIHGDYDSDSSTEDVSNTIGNVPLEWYDDYPHIGYDIDGKKVLKPAQGDELEKFLSSMDDPDSWKSVKDDLHGKDIVLNDEELEIIRRIEGGRIPDMDYDPYEPTVEWFTSKPEVMPLSAVPEPKRRFVPSKHEAKRIMKIVRAIREGRIVPRKPKTVRATVYNLWNDDEEPTEANPAHIPAPKMRLPEHDESYNPPEEYLPTEEEKKEWESLDLEDRPKNYLPQRFTSLRLVPAYQRFMQEKFQRCLDLYLAPRVRKNRLNIDPESLIPKLPSPKDLRPFPTIQSLSYVGHTARIRTFAVDPTGLFLVSGSDDGTLRLWEVATTRCLHVWELGDVIHSIAWNPNKDYPCFAVSVGHGQVVIIAPRNICSPEQSLALDAFLKAGFPLSSNDSDSAPKGAQWQKPSEKEETNDLIKIRIQHTQVVKQITWHRKGNYMATVAPDAQNFAILVHDFSKHQTQNPFRKLKGLVQKVIFHPLKPLFFVSTQRYVRVYDLMQQQLVKTLQSGVKWISSIDLHPGGDNVIIGSYDKRLCWFDMDLSSKPYKTLRYHSQAIRQVAFHKRYPLFASCSDDGTIQIFHGMVYNDLLQNPLIVPVKILKGHAVKSSLGALHCEFHPTQPWIFSAGADGTLRLWT
ncbi:hypothetical protein BZG36_02927 [Bifiguratus adelaidae]|uniref:Ribosome biogenesis protein ERB1 n=1 Tax=Bifiguratus adelaidae TaxID=1938954 RepID=A0A261Y0B0_9FUNG|nr:hypothetical protein BZG36_02927 [Bifiguratus adelaidae]